jgi:hypothetical protein
MADWSSGAQGAGQGAAAGAAFGPWGAGIGAGLGLIGGLMGRGGEAGQRYMNPQQMMSQLQGVNPWLYGALTGKWTPQGPSGSALGQYFSRMVNNPGYIDPRVMNMPYTQIERQGDSNMQRMAGMLGRNNMVGSGGVANMYAMANLATRGQQRAGVAQNYVLQREQQRRADINNLMQMMQGAQFGQAPQYWQNQTQGNVIGNAMQGAGMMLPYLMQPGQQQQQQQQSPYMPYQQPWQGWSSGSTPATNWQGWM